MKKIMLISFLLSTLFITSCAQFDSSILIGRWEVINSEGIRAKDNIGATFTWDAEGNMKTEKVIDLSGTYKVNGNTLEFTTQGHKFVYTVSMDNDILVLKPKDTEDVLYLKKK